MPDNISSSATVVPARPRLLRTGRGRVILDLEDGTYCGLNEVGADIWALLDAPRRVADSCGELHGAHDVEREVLERGVVDLLFEMHDRGLMCRGGSPTTSRRMRVLTWVVEALCAP